MNDGDRIALHRKPSEGMIDAFVKYAERQRVELPRKFVASEDATLWASMVYGNQEHQYARELCATGRTPSERNTLEFRKYRKVMPDFRLVAHGTPFVTEDGSPSGSDLKGRPMTANRTGSTRLTFFRRTSAAR